ncbi:Lipopolysaccharide kinase (Kdo/WaaP) family [Mycolicibacterium gilvum]|uniref:Lipopolysaccharide kinase (Kdo/WaaP) family n=1 Tax=Mycolicibacterium gilvum TaxID=1804 RepID=A0A379MM21_9MYCO|nr:Lipopolysaccharide kinase (Kdo/WaaP) family [Mycolicibacterium gilvum]
MRWLLSERAGQDVGTERALQALARNVVPSESAAQLAVVEVPTEPFSVLDDE